MANGGQETHWAKFVNGPDELNTLLRQCFLSNHTEIEVDDKVEEFVKAMRLPQARECRLATTGKGIVAKILDGAWNEVVAFFIGCNAFPLKALLLDLSLLLANAWNSEIEVQKPCHKEVATRGYKGGWVKPCSPKGGHQACPPNAGAKGVCQACMQKGWMPRLVFCVSRGKERAYEREVREANNPPPRNPTKGRGLKNNFKFVKSPTGKTYRILLSA